jgi:hypothetical protein
MKPCLRCEELTVSECVCGHAYCYTCRQVLKTSLCPMCTRIAAIQQEYAMFRRVVPWQIVEDIHTTALFLSVGSPVDPGASTEPVMKVKVEAR